MRIAPAEKLAYLDPNPWQHETYFDNCICLFLDGDGPLD